MKSWKYGMKWGYQEIGPTLTYLLPPSRSKRGLWGPRTSAPSFAARSAPREGADSL